MSSNRVFANPITRQRALQNVEGFLAAKGKTMRTPSLRHAPMQKGTTTADESLYVFNVGDDEGFVIAAGDDCVPAILGYSDRGTFNGDSLPVNVKSWLDGYSEGIRLLQASGQRAPRRAQLHANIPEMLTCMWNQGNPYNMYCPTFFDTGETCVTGCVATAMAQIMYYHRARSVRSVQADIPAYICDTEWEGYGQLSVSGVPKNSPIDWNDMTDTYNSRSTDAAKRAVANLMLYCGVSVGMDYGRSSTGGSGAISAYVVSALKNYFGYDAGGRYVWRSSYSDDAWDELIYNELANGRPVHYSGRGTEGGHAFVCDGYDVADGVGYYHINWGWGGSYDGNFLLDDLTPPDFGIGGSDGGFNSGQGAAIGVMPDGNLSPDDSPMYFSDAAVKAICVGKWDTNHDGELSYLEARAVTAIGTEFKGKSAVTSFDELRYFTNLKNIATEAFAGCSSLKSIIIPAKVSTIGTSVFSGCSALESVEVTPDNSYYDSRNGCNAIVRTADNCLVAGCKTTVIPADVVALGEAAFMQLPLVTVSIPKSVTTYGRKVFYGCDDIETVMVAAKTPAALTTDVFSCTSRATLVVPTGTLEAYGQAAVWKDFLHSIEISSATLPIQFADSNVKALCVANWDSDGDGELSFAEAAAVTDIGSVFQGNKDILSFDELQYFTGLTSIGDQAFYYCYRLTSVTLPETVTSIGMSAFQFCFYLTSINLPDNLESIEQQAFWQCERLPSLRIPAKVSSIGDYVFGYCRQLTDVSVDPANTVFDSREDCNAIIETATNTLYRAFVGTKIPSTVTTIGFLSYCYVAGLTELRIPSNVTSIANAAAFCCNDLEKVELPANLTYIGSQAFYPCENLAEVKAAMKTPVTIRENTFPSRANATLYVPTGCREAYLAADYWKEFKQIVEFCDGDVNGDACLDVADITLLVNIVAGYDAPDEIRRAADIDGDGEVTTADVELLVKKLLEVRQ
ncbi:MAG: leucine-rich repeat protein [Prevotella sp.]|nr:leucine-rich repeat protein [Prevotella sp.]MBR5036678.1 leucine-rich repeat protein [Prevotella sp.]